MMINIEIGGTAIARYFLAFYLQKSCTLPSLLEVSPSIHDTVTNIARPYLE